MEKDLKGNGPGYYARLKAQMSDDERVRDFQKKLYRKAKQERSFRFYALYDKLQLPHILREAYRRCRKKNGRPGVDNKSFTDIEKEEGGIGAFLRKIREELMKRTYRPEAVMRTYIPKANGKMRPLGIPTIKDRVVQMACKMVIEPIFEADFEDESYGFRPKRNAQMAMKKIKENLKDGKTEVLDADLSAYFDTIPHKELMILVAKRVSDRYILHLIKMWLKAPVVEDGKYSGGKKNKTGTPQGGVISPLLANIYLNTLDKAVNRSDGAFRKAGISIVRYADDFVLMGKQICTEIEWYLSGLLSRMRLNLNTEKTRKVNAKAQEFQFLGFSVRYDNDLNGGNHKYLNISPSKKALLKVQKNIKEHLRHNGHKNPQAICFETNRIIKGWLNYFACPGMSYTVMARKKLRYFLIQSFYRYFKRKSQRKCRLYNRGDFRTLVNKFGLCDPTTYRRSANA